MVATPAHASLIPNVTENEQITDGNLAGWTNASGSVAGYAYNFEEISAAQAVTPGAIGGDGTVELWSVGGANAGHANAAPVAGPILAMDSDFDPGALTTTLTGLSKGALETVSFYFSTSQQNTFSGESFDSVEVSAGGSGIGNTGVVVDQSESSTAWTEETFSFVASGSSESLSFLASGGECGNQSCTKAGDSNVPAFALLDDINVSQTPSPTPEPSSLMLMGTGLAGLASFVRSRFKNASANA